jgi:hypothetical protein
MSLPRWLYASTPGAVAPISVRLTDATPMPAGTVLARASGADPYVRHDPLAPGALGVARAVLLWPLPGEAGVHETIAITGGATLVGRLLNDGRGIDVTTHRDLEMNGLGVLV